MAGMNEEAQWLVLIGFIISIGIFFLGILMNQSILVGQTTAESVLEFPKSNIQDLRNEIRIINSRFPAGSERNSTLKDISDIALERKSEVIRIYQPGERSAYWEIHYNNGVTSYDEKIQYWDF